MTGTFLEYCDGCRIEVDIPKGFSFKEGNITNGYVIENDVGDQYVRIPAGYTSDGMYVKGFWISRYEISMGDDEIPRSIPNKKPLTNINFYNSVELAKKVDGVLLNKEDYNRVCMWLVETKAVTFEEVFLFGNDKGNYSKPFVKAKTGANPLWMINHIDNFFGNCYTWTTERSELYHHNRIIRGGYGSSFFTGANYPPSIRWWAKPEEGKENVGLRIVIRDDLED